jgi:RimJ/RimL family protein N-acetyltransferase
VRALVASRCTLEPLVVAHAKEMFCVLSDPAIYEFENAPPPSEEWLAARYRLLERRSSPDCSEQWLNWVVRLPTGELAGWVQGTVFPDAAALIAYELCSRHWRRGIGASAVTTLLGVLHSQYGVRTVAAVLKTANFRSLGLLRSLGFSPANDEQIARFGAEPDERVMVRAAAAAS